MLCLVTRQTIPPIPKNSHSPTHERESSKDDSLATSSRSTSRPNSPRNPAVGQVRERGQCMCVRFVFNVGCFILSKSDGRTWNTEGPHARLELISLYHEDLGDEVLLGIFGGVVCLCSPNPAPISSQSMLFSGTFFRPGSNIRTHFPGLEITAGQRTMSSQTSPEIISNPIFRHGF